MAQCYECLGIEDIMDNEENAMALVSHALENGKSAIGYYGKPYIHHRFGRMEMILQTEIENEEIKLTGVDMHVAGSSVWKLRCIYDITPDDWNNTDKRMIFSNLNGRGVVPIELMNSDVIPSYLEDDVITMQVVAFAEHIEYYENEDEYVNSLNSTEMGKTFGLEEGTVLPIELFSNNEEPDEEKQLDRGLALIRGKVKGAYWGTFSLSDTEYETFIYCRIDTEFGELEIIHSPDQIVDEQQVNLKTGATVSGLVRFSGDVAICEYEDGIVKDEENNLRLLRSILEGEDANRLSQVLVEDALYFSENLNELFEGKQTIIDRFNLVSEARRDNNIETYTSLAAITDFSDGIELTEKIGTRCIIVSNDEKDNYYCIVFVKYNDNGEITKINTTCDSRYIFKLDETLPIENPFENAIVPGTYFDAMINRAKFHGFLDEALDADVERGEILGSSNYIDYRENAKSLIAAWPEGIKSGDNEYMSRAFGYLFAKAMEFISEENVESYQKKRVEDSVLIASYRPNDCWDDKYNSVFENREIHKKLELANKYGRQFHRDYLNYNQDNKSPDEIYNEDEIINALTMVQQLGEYCVEYYLGKEISEYVSKDALQTE